MLKFFRNPKGGGLGFADPALRRHRYKDVWNSAAETEDGAKRAVAGIADEATLAEAAEMSLRLLSERVGIYKDDVILEIGCGVGRVGNVLAPLCRTWIGIDASDAMIGHAKRRLAHHSNVSLLATGGYDLAEVPSATIDLVYCTVVLMHLSQWDRYNYIREAFRVLKPDGRIYVDSVDMTSEAGWEFFLAHLALAPDNRPPNISELSTPQEIVTYLSRAGFKSIAHETSDLWLIAHARK